MKNVFRDTSKKNIVIYVSLWYTLKYEDDFTD